MSNLMKNPTLVQINLEEELVEGQEYLVWGGTGEICAMSAGYFRYDNKLGLVNALFIINTVNGDNYEVPYRFNEVMAVYKIVEGEK